MNFGEWFNAVIACLRAAGVKKIPLNRDGFADIIANYWDGYTPQLQAQLLQK